MTGRPPGPASRLLPRPGLVARLADPWPRRLTVLTAGAGYGKSTLVRQWLGDRPVAWVGLARVDRSVDVLAPRLLAALRDLGIGDEAGATAAPGAHQALVDDLDHAETVARSIALVLADARAEGSVIVLDDLHELEGGSAAAFVAALVRQVPSTASLVVTTRTALPFPIQRLRPRGEVTELTAQDLALDASEVRRLAIGVLGPDGEAVADDVRTRTGGWPAMTRLTLEALRTRPARAWPDALDGAGSDVFAYLAEEVLAHEPAPVVELIRTIAPFEEVDVGLCAALGLPEPAVALADLERRGLFVAQAGRQGTFTLHRLLRDAALERLPLDPARAVAVRATAIEWLEDRGRAEEAMQLAADGTESVLIAGLVRRHGTDLVGRGRGAVVLGALGHLDAATASEPGLRLLEGDARASLGDTDGALAAYRAVAGEGGALPAPVAWRMTRALLDGHAYEAARVAADRGMPDGASVDAALLLAYQALVRYFANDHEGRDLALRAVDMAEAMGDPRARSLAHTAACYTSRGVDHDSARRHHRAATVAAEEAGDIVQRIRLLGADDEDPSLPDQLATAHETVALAETLGHPLWLTRTLENRALLRLELGQLEAAAVDLERVRAISISLGRPMPPMASIFEADVARLRGDLATAMARFRQVIADTTAAGYPDIVAFAEAHLARQVAGSDPGEARRLVAAALRDVAPIHRPDAVLAAAWVALRQDRVDEATAAAREVIELTVASPGWAYELAQAIEVEACASPDPARRVARLAEAEAVWLELGNQRAAALTRYAIAAFGHGPASAAAAEARAAAEALGVSVAPTEDCDLRAFVPAVEAPSVVVRLLGGFAVIRDGTTVTIPEWKSRKARDVLKILALHPGRPVTRDELIDLLWPGEAPDEVGGRLSVALSLLRSVLDPGHRRAADHHVTTTRDAVSLRPEDLDTDLEAFRRDARGGLARAGQGDRAGAVTLLSAAEVRYAGDLLPEDAFADWAVAPREEARALFLQVSRTLARLAREEGDEEAAARHLMRTVEVDAYDEAAHLELVRSLEAGRHRGAARRAYELYVRRMAELEIEPAPYPGPAAS